MTTSFALAVLVASAGASLGCSSNMTAVRPQSRFRPTILTTFGQERHQWPWQSYRGPHSGVDFALEQGQHVIASASGQVLDIIDTHTGSAISIWTSRPCTRSAVCPFGKLHLIWTYGHVAHVKVRSKHYVTRGQILGVGWEPPPNTMSWIRHVHLEVRQRIHDLVDPMRFTRQCVSNTDYDGDVLPVEC